MGKAETDMTNQNAGTGVAEYPADQAEYREGNEISGYRLKKVIAFDEIHSLVYELQHLITGARHLHIKNSDRENAFGVIFKTVPTDSTGVAHILEHTILCGSEKYPVRDPFFSMIKRSLSSFMNALTASDWTMYPFATPNAKDFYNLMDVYLDAVFFPNLTELSFKQEGYRLEVVPAPVPDDEGASVDAWDLAYKGVVYNEMKGAMSSADQIMSRGILRALYPDTTYSNNSGGDPTHIPSLTHEQLKAFHRRHYHPSNAFFYTYGNLPLADHLDIINNKVLSRFDRIDPDTDVPAQPRWNAPRSMSQPYPVSGDEPTERKFQACVAWLTAETMDSREVFSLIVLEQVLLGNQAAPLRKALIDSGLGSALSDGAGFDDELKDTMFACGLKDIAEKDVQAVEDLIMNTLSAIAETGIDPELIESAIHQIEFHRKEITNTPYPYGIKLLLNLSGSWIHGTDPADIIQITPYIDWLHAEMDKGPFLEKQIQKYFLDNPHRVTFTLMPDPNMAEREEAGVKEKLNQIRQTLSPEEIAAIKEDAQKLEQLQMEAENVSVLPTLALSDIPPDLQTAEAVPKTDNLLCFPQPTSGIVYYSALAGISGVSESLLPLVPFFCLTMSRMGTKKRDYVELTRFLDLHTGGISLSAQVRTPYKNGPVDAECLPCISFFGKALARKQDRLFEIIEEIQSQYDFSNLTRLGQLLTEYRATQEAAVVHNGHRLAISLASRNMSLSSALSELWYGVHQLQYLKEITSNLNNEKLADIADHLSQIAAAVFISRNLKVGLVGEEENLARAEQQVADLDRALPSSAGRNDQPFGGPSFFAPEDRFLREGWHTSSAVSFVATVFPAVRMGHADAPALSVISKLLRASFLHREIREKGGAYGGFALYHAEDGRFGMASYRDPHIAATLDVYQRAVDYIQSGKYADEDIKESVLQVCSDIDKPLTPVEKGMQAFHHQHIGMTNEKRAEFKKGVLAVTRETVIAAAKTHFPSDPTAFSTAVISGEKQLVENNGRLASPLSLHAI